MKFEDLPEETKNRIGPAMRIVYEALFLKWEQDDQKRAYGIEAASDLPKPTIEKQLRQEGAYKYSFQLELANQLNRSPIWCAPRLPTPEEAMVFRSEVEARKFEEKWSSYGPWIVDEQDEKKHGKFLRIKNKFEQEHDEDGFPITDDDE